MMKERDKAILDDLVRFRCMSRDDIAAVHFTGRKTPIKLCNDVMRRLRLQGYVDTNQDRRPYVYFPAASQMKKNSQKVDHFLSIVKVYRDLRSTGKLRLFDVEPKYGQKGTVEPDAFAIWQGAPWFIEMQRSIYREKTIQKKLKRYEQYKREGKWRQLSWQPEGKEVYPYVWIIGEKQYDTSAVRGFRVFQSSSVEDFIKQIS